jgi:hypothetical protein
MWGREHDSVQWAARRNTGAAHADYCAMLHQHMADLARDSDTRKAEVARWEGLRTTFRVMSSALYAIDPKDAHAPRHIAALEHYMYNVGKCEYKNILGHGRPAVEDCAAHGFFMVDPVARQLMQEARANHDDAAFLNRSYWDPPPPSLSLPRKEAE